jgi:S1-C subfamily serine protease
MDNNGNGARVQRVVKGGPADAADIATGDVITGVDNVAITGATSMTEVLVPHHPGDTIAVHYRANDGAERTVNITLAEGPPA